MQKSLSIIVGVLTAAALCWTAAYALPDGPLRMVAYIFAVLFGLGAGRAFAGSGKQSMRPLVVSTCAAVVGCYLVAHLLPAGVPSMAAYVLVLATAFGTGTGMQRFFP